MPGDAVLGDLLAGLVLLAVIAYAVLGGADFGGGIWDLCAGGPRRHEQRQSIAHAMGPVWEANHVWLIFVIVLLFSGFPAAFAALSIGLFVPFHLVLVGITLRGAAFVFRAYGPKDQAAQRRFGALFGGASVITPILLGMCLGAVSAGRMRILQSGDPDQPLPLVLTLPGPEGAVGPPWLGPLPIVMGLLALALCAYLAAVYLTLETDGPLQRDFRLRALVSGGVVVALSALLLPLLVVRAPHLWRGLSGWALPLLAAGSLAALGSGAALLLGRYRLARAATIVQVVCLVAGWGVAQHPYLIYPDVRLHDALAPAGPVRFILWSLPGGALVLGPSLYYLFRVFKGRSLPS